MNLFRSSRSRSHYPIEDDRPAKRISTPAGQRLSVILENKRSKSPASTDSTAKINVTTESTFCNDPSHQHVNPVQHSHKNEKKSGGIFAAFTGGRLSTPDNCETRGNNGSNLSVSVWSDKDDEKFGHVRHRRKKGIFGWGWKKTALIIAIILALIVGLAVGLAMGLKKNHKNPSATTAEDSHSAGGTTNNNQNSHPGSPSSNTEAPSRPAAVKPTLPPNFPVGTFSFVVFLDTTTPECTSNPDTWTCAPKTDYYSDPQKALTVFNWQVTGSSGSYKISTQGEDQIFDTTFQNEPLQLLDAGKDTERLKFQISRSKTVNMTGTLGGSKGDFECEYDATNIQGVLYTKMTRTYPDDTIAVKNTPNPEWPFAVRIEQNVAGGQGVPSCQKSSGGSVDIKGQDASTLCACLYRNWTQ